MALYDDKGNEVEGALTPEEVQAKIDADKKVIEDAAIEQYKKDNPPAPAPAEVIPPKTEEAPAIQTDPAVLARLDAQERERLADKFAGQDPQKRADFLASYNKLTGFANDEAGIAARAADAQKLAFGTAPSVDVNTVAGTGGGRNADGAAGKPVVDLESPAAKLFGVTKEDAEKFGPAVEKAFGASS